MTFCSGVCVLSVLKIRRKSQKTWILMFSNSTAVHESFEKSQDILCDKELSLIHSTDSYEKKKITESNHRIDSHSDRSDHP